MTDTPFDPIRRSVTVPLDPRAAFDLFTDGIDRWWPKETHSLTARNADGKGARVRVEPFEGGRVLETLPDGTEAPWADVAQHRPAERLTLRWYVGRHPGEATLVDIRFTAVDGGTRIDLTHSGFDVLGMDAAPVSSSYAAGWEHVLGVRFAGACRRIPA